MTFNEFNASERKNLLVREWQYLTTWQKNLILIRFAIGILPRLTLDALNNHIQRRRTRFIYQYRVHWVGK